MSATVMSIYAIPEAKLTARDIDKAKLPALYVSAQTALSKCDKLDECYDWKNKMEALASYARQSRSTELADYAQRIHNRALQRLGELLKELPPNKRGGKPIPKQNGARPILVSQRDEAARQNKISPDVQRDAIKIANIEPAEFERVNNATPAPSVRKMLSNMKKNIHAEIAAEKASKPPQVKIFPLLLALRTLVSSAKELKMHSPDAIDKLLKELSKDRLLEMDELSYKTQDVMELLRERLAIAMQEENMTKYMREREVLLDILEKVMQDEVAVPVDYILSAALRYQWDWLSVDSTLYDFVRNGMNDLFTTVLSSLKMFPELGPDDPFAPLQVYYRNKRDSNIEGRRMTHVVRLIHMTYDEIAMKIDEHKRSGQGHLNHAAALTKYRDEGDEVGFGDTPRDPPPDGTPPKPTAPPLPRRALKTY